MEQREHIRFCNVKRKKDFICLERVNGKIVNILDGLELHTGVFSMAEQNRIVKFVEKLEEIGKSGQLKGQYFLINYANHFFLFFLINVTVVFVSFLMN